MTKSAVCVFAVVLLAAGCVGKRSGGTAFRYRQWTEGVTTKLDVVDVWGNPDAMEDGVWIWRESRHIGGKIKASYYGIGFTVARENIAMFEHRLEFDGSGRLVGQEIHRSVSGGPRWAINPW